MDAAATAGTSPTTPEELQELVYTAVAETTAVAAVVTAAVVTGNTDARGFTVAGAETHHAMTAAQVEAVNDACDSTSTAGHPPHPPETLRASVYSALATTIASCNGVTG